jgi:hypothetical protein
MRRNPWDVKHGDTGPRVLIHLPLLPPSHIGKFQTLTPNFHVRTGDHSPPLPSCGRPGRKFTMTSRKQNPLNWPLRICVTLEQHIQCSRAVNKFPDSEFGNCKVATHRRIHVVQGAPNAAHYRGRDGDGTSTSA